MRNFQPRSTEMTEQNEEIIAEKAAEYMKKCGVPNNLHSRLLCEICELIYQDENVENTHFKPLLSNVHFVEEESWDPAIEIVMKFLQDNHMDNTYQAFKIEYSYDYTFQDTLSDDKPADEVMSKLISENKNQPFRKRVEMFLRDLKIEDNGIRKNPVNFKDIVQDISSSDHESSLVATQDESFDEP